jgi:hypothetical protein
MSGFVCCESYAIQAITHCRKVHRSISIAAIAVIAALTGPGTPARRVAYESTSPVVRLKAPLASRAGYGALPLRFEANRGQTDASVDFVSRGLGYGVFLTASDAVIAVKRGGRQTAIRMKIAGANPDSRPEPLDRLATRSNYFIGNDPARWRTDVPNYARVRYPGVYKGIDLLYYGQDGELEYDLIVAPGADPRQVVFEMAGAERLEVDKNGNLQATLDAGSIDTSWNGDTATTNIQGDAFVAKLSSSGTSFAYVTYLGGTNGDFGHAIAVDASGNAYVAGGTNSTDFPTFSDSESDSGGVSRTRRPLRHQVESDRLDDLRDVPRRDRLPPRLAARRPAPISGGL